MDSHIGLIFFDSLGYIKVLTNDDRMVESMFTIKSLSIKYQMSLGAMVNHGSHVSVLLSWDEFCILFHHCNLLTYKKNTSKLKREHTKPDRRVEWAESLAQTSASIFTHMTFIKHYAVTY